MKIHPALAMAALLGCVSPPSSEPDWLDVGRDAADTDTDTDTDTDADTDADTDTAAAWARDGDRFELEPITGYAVVTVTNVEGDGAALELYVDGEYTFYQGKDLAGHDLVVWFAMSADRQYELELSGNDRLRCSVGVETFAIDDGFEPNDAPADAATAGDTVTGWFHTGASAGGTSTSAYDDWYRVETDGGPVTFTITDVPEDATAGLTAWNPADLEWSLDWETGRYAGTDVSLTVDPEGARTLLVQVQAWGMDTFGADTLPASFLHPYTLTLEST